MGPSCSPIRARRATLGTEDEDIVDRLPQGHLLVLSWDRNVRQEDGDMVNDPVDI